MDAALHQHARSTHLLRLCDLFVDLLKIQNVTLVRRGPFQRPVECAEGAVLRAEIGVVDVAVDDVGDHALGMKAATYGVGLKAQADQVGGVEIVERLLAGQRHSLNFTNSQVLGRFCAYRLMCELSLPGASGLRNRNNPRPSTGVFRVLDRLDAVETPLNRNKKSRNALRKPLCSVILIISASLDSESPARDALLT